MTRTSEFIKRLRGATKTWDGCEQFDKALTLGNNNSVVSWVEGKSSEDKGTHSDMSGGLGRGGKSKLHLYQTYFLHEFYRFLSRKGFDTRPGVEYGCHLSENFSWVHKLFFDLD